MINRLLGGTSNLRLPARAAVTVLAVTALVLAALPMVAKPAQASTFTVTKTADTNDHICSAADCSLREAIVAANTSAGSDTINIPAGSYALTIAGAYEDAAATGDLDVTDDLTITGAGAGSTTIDAAGIDRVFEDLPGKTLTISGVTIKGGLATSNTVGGGILVDSPNATLMLNDAIITGNKADFAGGIYVNSGSTATLNNDTINNNTASSTGGGIYVDGSTLTMTNSTINNNTAGFSGGGLFFRGFGFGHQTLTNDTISTNTVVGGGGGGGMTVSGSFTLTVANSTINNNTATTFAGGGVLSDRGATIEFQNSIVANSIVGGDCSNFGAGQGTITSLGNNLSSDNTCGFTKTTDKPQTDPKLGPLQNNGGPTDTHALLAGSSPAIDTGSNTGCPPPNTDQRGVARPQDGDNNGSAICDIGAFELAALLPPVANNDSYSATQDQTLNEPATDGVLKNDTDPNSPANMVVGSFTNPSNGTLVLNPDGSFAYTPNQGFSGSDTFTYKAKDGTVESNIATVSITVASAPPAPAPPVHKKKHKKKHHH